MRQICLLFTPYFVALDVKWLFRLPVVFANFNYRPFNMSRLSKTCLRGLSDTLGTAFVNIVPLNLPCLNLNHNGFLL